MKRMFLKITALLLAGLLLSTGCGPSEEDLDGNNTSGSSNTASSDNKNITLRLVTMFSGTDAAKGILEEAIQEFMDIHKNVNIVNESVQAGEDFRVKVKTAFALGDEPDVTYFFTGADARFLIESKAVYPFDELLAADTGWSGAILESALDSMRVDDGKIYTIPVNGFYEGLFCNKDIFDKYNLELPTTWDHFVAAIKTLSAEGIVPVAASLDESYYLIEKFILSAGGPEGHNSAFADGIDPSWIEGLNYIKEVYEMGAFPKNAFLITDSDAQELFQNKEAAMLINGSWAVQLFPDKKNTVVIPFPVVPGGKALSRDVIGGITSGYYLSRKSHEDPAKKGKALELIKFLTRPEKIKKFAAAQNAFPTANVQMDNVSPVAQMGYSMAQAGRLSYPIDAQIAPAAFTEIRKNVPFIVEGKITAEEVLERAYQLHLESINTENQE